MGALSMTGKALAALAAVAVLSLTPMPSMASGEMPCKPACPPPAAKCKAPCSLCEVLLYYVPNRALDLLDVGRLSLGFGCGFGVNVRATELAEVGFGQYQSTRFGMKGRVLPVYEENIDECGIALLGWVNGCLQRDPTEVGADLHIGIIGAQAAVSLAEAADFITGLVLIDLQGDDLGCSPWD